MDYEITLSGMDDDSLIQLANHQRAFKSLREIHSIALGLKRYVEEEDSDLDPEDFIEEVKASMHDIFLWTQLDGVF